MDSKARSPFIPTRLAPWLLLVLVIGLELGFRIIDPYSRQIPAAEQYRNAMHKEAWPEFTATRAAQTGKLAIHIGSSQAYGTEIKDPARIAFGVVKDRVTGSTQLENWAITGLRTSDLELLTIQAQLRLADRMVIGINFGNFDYPQQITLDYPNSDVNLILGDPQAWPLFENTLVRKNTSRDQFIGKWVKAHSSTVRFRRKLYQYIAPWVPDQDEVLVFGNPVSRGRNFDLQKTPDFRQRFVKKPRERLTQAEMSIRAATFEGFVEALVKRTVDYQGEVIVYLTPLDEQHFAPEDWKMIETFNQRALDVLAKHNVQAVDLTDSIPTDLFVSRGHFTEQGHRQFAKHLYPLLAP